MSTAPMAPARCYTPPTAAEFLGISQEKIIAWIKRGELRASNITGDPQRRPRWIITPDALDEFLRRRQPQAPTKRTRRPRETPAEVDYLADV